MRRGWLSRKRTSRLRTGSCGSERHFQAKALQTLDVVALQSFSPDVVEVVATQFLVGPLLFENVVRDHQNSVSHSYVCSLSASACSQAMELGCQISLFGAAGCPRGLAQQRSQPGVPVP